MGWRFRLILAHDGVAVQAFDQDEWVRNLRYQDTDPAESVDQFEPARKANLQLIRRVEPRTAARIRSAGARRSRTSFAWSRGTTSIISRSSRAW